MKIKIKNKKNFKFGLKYILFGIVCALISGVGECLFLTAIGVVVMFMEEDLD